MKNGFCVILLLLTTLFQCQKLFIFFHKYGSGLLYLGV